VDIQGIIDAVRYNRVRISVYADEEAQADHLSFDEIFYRILCGEIIEEHPSDKPYPRCLIHGDSFAGQPVHRLVFAPVGL
jgi:hypothetical protein